MFMSVARLSGEGEERREGEEEREKSVNMYQDKNGWTLLHEAARYERDRYWERERFGEWKGRREWLIFHTKKCVSFNGPLSLEKWRRFTGNSFSLFLWIFSNSSLSLTHTTSPSLSFSLLRRQSEQRQWCTPSPLLLCKVVWRRERGSHPLDLPSPSRRCVCVCVNVRV